MEKTKEELERKIIELQNENDVLWSIIGYVKSIERRIREDRDDELLVVKG